MIDLGTLGGAVSVAQAINARGQIVGFSETSGGEIHAFLWDRGVITDLGASLGTISYANDIDQSGRYVVGSVGSYGAGTLRAALWTLR